MSDLAAKLKKAFKGNDPNAVIPKKRLEYMLKRLDPTFTDDELNALFEIADKNRDGMIQQDEFVDFVCFLDSDSYERADPETDEQPVEYGNNRKYETPWANKSSVVKDAVQILYRVVRELDIDPSVENESFSRAGLLAAIEPNGAMEKVKSEIQAEAEEEKNLKMKQLSRHLFDRLHSMEFIARVKTCPEVLHLETLIELTWPKVKGKDKEMVLSWLQEFKMKDVVRRFFHRVMDGDPPHLTPADIRFIFKCMDVDKDGAVTVNELRRAFLTMKEAKWLINKFDTNWDKKLQIQEIMTAVFGDSQGEFADSFKAAFSGSLF